MTATVLEPDEVLGKVGTTFLPELPASRRDVMLLFVFVGYLAGLLIYESLQRQKKDRALNDFCTGLTDEIGLLSEKLRNGLTTVKAAVDESTSV